MGQAVKAWHPSGPLKHGTKGVCPMSNRNDQSKKSFTAFDQGTTLLAVVELSRNFWLVAGIVPGIERQPSKKLAYKQGQGDEARGSPANDGRSVSSLARTDPFASQPVDPFADF